MVHRYIDDQGVQLVRQAHQLDTFEEVDSRLSWVYRVLRVLRLHRGLRGLKVG